ncbi:MAG TPA: glycosyltransferase family 4 protein, partial [Candidatus Acidoferrum sp.]|nr:glycosyltransferase family 4 protein [Candidatus Acidoferrum sp.]
MTKQRFKVLAVASHPVQYMAPLFRRMGKEASLELQVVYCSLRGAAAAGYDPDFQAAVQWDVPLLDGYSWTEIPNQGSGAESFWGLNNPGLRNVIREGQFDAVLCYLSYTRSSFWIALRAAKSSRAAFLFGTDAHTLAPRDAKRWKVGLKRVLWPWLFGQADQVFVPSSGTFDLIRRLGIPPERITLTPYSVDNEWWKAESAKVNRAEVRARWGLTNEQPVILFCAKLAPWKRPMDLLHAFAQARPDLADAQLIFAGDGAQRAELEAETHKLGLQQSVLFWGFVNQSRLPALYTAADLLVLPSEYEPFAVVVNEAMCCGCPAMVSDRVGAARDLVAPVRAEFVFRAGNVAALADSLKNAFADRQKLRETAERAREYVETHSPQKTVASTAEAVRKAV